MKYLRYKIASMLSTLGATCLQNIAAVLTIVMEIIVPRLFLTFANTIRNNLANTMGAISCAT